MFNVKLVCLNSLLSKLELICVLFDLETKLTDYLIYNIVDQYLYVKLGLKFKNKKKMCTSNHIWCHKHFWNYNLNIKWSISTF